MPANTRGSRQDVGISSTHSLLTKCMTFISSGRAARSGLARERWVLRQCSSKPCPSSLGRTLVAHQVPQRQQMINRRLEGGRESEGHASLQSRLAACGVLSLAAR